ncbi:MAG: LptF/LptG family permease, partial [Verrucomicrobiota bacterium]
MARFVRRCGEALKERLTVLSNGRDRGAVALKLATGGLLAGLSLVLYGTIVDYQEASDAIREAEDAEATLRGLPSLVPMVWQSIGVFLAFLSLGCAFLVRGKVSEEVRRNLTVISLSIAAIAALASWLPTDIIATMEAISGKALAGETPSIPAYFGQLFLISLLIVSVPVAAMVYFQLSLMDRYVVHNFLSPFSFCLFSFIAIWVIGDFTDNGASFAGLPIGRVMQFYLVQVPYVILFVMPIVVLLSGLFALSKMSKSNELISMIGAGRSVTRILTPLFVIGAYASLVCLAFKYEWAPASVGYKEALLETANKEAWARKHGKEVKEIWAKRGWMHVNEVDRRTWFVGRVPFRLSDEMADVVIWELREDGHPKTLYKAKRARWLWDAEPPTWEFLETQIYEYDENHIPRIR